MNQVNDIVETNHCVDEECPVTDVTKEYNLLLLSEQERHEKEAFDIMQQTAIDTYTKVLAETGDSVKAEEAFFQIHRNFYNAA